MPGTTQSIKNPNTVWQCSFSQGIQFGRHPTPVLLPGKSHGQRTLVGCSPWGREELDTTERLPFHFSLSCIGEGNGNPLQCSCLENPRDSGAWWASVCGVAQSRTRLKRLSRSSREERQLKQCNTMHSALWQRCWTRHVLNGVCCLRTGLEKSEKLLWLKFLEAKPVTEILEKMSSRESILREKEMEKAE